MAYLTVLFVVILAANKVTSIRCSDQQLPASGDDGHQQVTTLQYCLVDDCTIKRIDTGEKLDIAYTTNSLIVTTPIDGRTSEVISKLGNELPCINSDGTFDYRVQEVVEIIEFSLTFIVSGYIIAIHIMFKELQNLLGKLLVLHSICVLGLCIAYFGILLTPLQPIIDLLAFCYVSIISLMLSSVGIEALATCILSYIAMIMRRMYKRRSRISKEASQRHFRRYVIYTLGTILLVLFLIICFDAATGNYKDVLHKDGRCVSFEVGAYSALQIGIIISTINKIAQLVQFITYLYYMYKIRKDIDGVDGSSEVNPYLHKLAAAMGVFIGLSYFLFTLTAIFDLAMVVIPFTQALFLMQQSAVVAIFLCSKKVRHLHKECFSKNRSK